MKPIGRLRPINDDQPVGRLRPIEEAENRPVGTLRAVGEDRPVGRLRAVGSDEPVRSTESTAPSFGALARGFGVIPAVGLKAVQGVATGIDYVFGDKPEEIQRQRQDPSGALIEESTPTNIALGLAGAKGLSMLGGGRFIPAKEAIEQFTIAPVPWKKPKAALPQVAPDVFTVKPAFDWDAYHAAKSIEKEAQVTQEAFTDVGQRSAVELPTFKTLNQQMFAPIAEQPMKRARVTKANPTFDYEKSQTMLRDALGYEPDLLPDNPMLRQYGDPEKIVYQPKIKIKSGSMAGEYAGLPLSESMVNSFMHQVGRYTEGFTGNVLENPIYKADQVPVMKEFWHKFKRGEMASLQEFKAVKGEADSVFNGIPKQGRINLGANMVAAQEKGESILKRMNVRPQALSGPETMARDYLRSKFDETLVRLNNARVIAGQKPIGKMDDYFTFMRAVNKMSEEGISPVQANEALFHPNAIAFRFARERTKKVAPVELDAAQVFNVYMRNALNTIHQTPNIAQARLLLNRKIPLDDSGKYFSLRETNPAAHKYFNEWVDAVAQKRSPGTFLQLPASLDRALNRLNKNNAAAMLSFNISSTLKQPLAFVNTVSMIGPKNLSVGMLDNLNPSMRAFADKSSNVLATREFDVAIADVARRSKTVVGKGFDYLTEFGIKPLEMMDKETARATWLGAFRKAKSDKLSQREAIRYADEVVTKTQASASRIDTSPIQRTAAGRALTLFQTFTINDWNFLRHEVLGIQNDIPKAEIARRVVTMIVAAESANAIGLLTQGRGYIATPLSEFVESQMAGDDIEVSAVKAAVSPMQRMPIVGGMRYGGIAPGIDMAGRIVKDVYRQGYPDPLTVAPLFGIPGVAQARRLLREDQ